MVLRRVYIFKILICRLLFFFFGGFSSNGYNALCLKISGAYYFGFFFFFVKFRYPNLFGLLTHNRDYLSNS